MTVDELHARWREGDEGAMNELIEAMMPTVRSIACWHAREGARWHWDVMSACMEGAWAAARKWTPSGGKGLRGWICDAVGYAALDALRTYGPQKRKSPTTASALYAEFTKAWPDVQPTKTEICSIAFDRRGTRKACAKLFNGIEKPMADVLGEHADDRYPTRSPDCVVGGGIAGDGVDARDELEWLLSQLGEPFAGMLRLYWLEGDTMKEIGRKNDLSEGRIQRMLCDAMDELRKIVAERGDMPRIDDKLTAKAVRAALWKASEAWEGPKLMMITSGTRHAG